MTRTAWLALAWAWALWLLSAPAAQAHEISMAEMELRETARGEFIWGWTAGNRTADGDLTPRWPEGCVADDNLLRCGTQGMVGRFGMEGVGKKFSAVLVKVYWLDGGLRVYTFSSGQTELQVFGSADDKRGMGEIARAYTVLGIEHILAGLDHLLFVVGLLFLVGFRRQLVWTISAFTLAHSLSLGLSALGWIHLRSAPVEATIALSIMLVAAESLHREQTLSRRWPALVALLFGLVHGLGFAGALQQIGLPQNHLLVALLTFNLGVEIGQLAVVLALYLLWRAASAWPALVRARTPALYLIGALAGWWAIERLLKVVAGA